MKRLGLGTCWLVLPRHAEGQKSDCFTRCWGQCGIGTRAWEARPSLHRVCSHWGHFLVRGLRPKLGVSEVILSED